MISGEADDDGLVCQAGSWSDELNLIGECRRKCNSLTFDPFGSKNGDHNGCAWYKCWNGWCPVYDDHKSNSSSALFMESAVCQKAFWNSTGVSICVLPVQTGDFCEIVPEDEYESDHNPNVGPPNNCGLTKNT